jgi:transposase InsO family protein
MARAGFGGDRTIARHLHLHGETLSARSIERFRENPLGREPRPESKRTSRRIKRAPDVYDACAAFLALPEPFARPRLARHIMSLADALAEAVAADSLRRLDDGSLHDPETPLRRTRLAQRLAILHARLSRVPPRHRPRYTDSERAAILALKHRFRLSHATLAAWFLLDPGTVSDWMRDVDHPDLRLRPLVQPIADLETAVAHVQSTLPPLPRRLQGKVQAALAALAARAPVPRWSTRRRRADRKTARSRPVRPRTLTPIRALYANHFWSADLTVIALGHTFHLLAIVDLYSRDVLAWELVARKPGSRELKALFEQAVARHGQPENFVSDQGEEFQGELKAALDERDIDHRQGAVGQHGSIAIIERLWRSAKEHLDLKAVRPQIPAILLERVATVIDYYKTKRPHSTLGNATPHEVYQGLPSRAHEAKPMPRGWPGEPSRPAPFVIRHAFPDERTLPYLERVA